MKLFFSENDACFGEVVGGHFQSYLVTGQDADEIEPHFAADYATEEEWKQAPYRIGAKIHPLTVEQNALTSFKSRTTLVPCRANTIGPGIFLQADYAIGGADGVLGRGMQWQGLSLWMTLRHGTTPWITSTYIPTLPGRLFFLEELAGPLTAECN